MAAGPAAIKRFWKRCIATDFSRRGPDGSDLYHTFYHLGAPSTDLAAISWFFNCPFDVPVAGLSTKNRRWLLHTSGLYLYSQGRLAEAQTALQSHSKFMRTQTWKNFLI